MKTPPRWVIRFIEKFAPPNYKEDILGDLDEMFAQDQRHGARYAQHRYLRNSIGFLFKGFFWKQNYQPNDTMMIRSYFKIAWRTLLKNKGYNTINIVGLAIGMAVAILIGLWVYNEYSYDKFLPDYQQVYRVNRNFDSNGDTLTLNSTSLKLADALRNEIPEIEYAVESDWMGRHGLTAGEKKFYFRGAQAGSDFLKVFQYPLLHGDKNTVLSDPYSIVLTEFAARSLFGDTNPINKTVRFDNQHDLKVTGILKDIPSNSSLWFNWIVPFSYMEQTRPGVKRNREGSFERNGYQLFVKLKSGITQAQAESKIRNIEHTEKENANAMHSYVILHPLKDWHLFSEYKNGRVAGGFIEYVRMFGIIGILVLIIACINFINLTTARSEKRAREVGVRKTMGSQKKQLIIQFLTESFLLTVLAFLFSLLIVQLISPAFTALTGSAIRIPFASPIFWMVMLSSIFLTSLLAGSRPAFYLSSFNPVAVLKGTFHTGKSAALPRKILVVVQFSCSIALIISTVIIFQQVQHARNRPTGYNLDGVMVTNSSEELALNYTALKNELIHEGVASSVTHASSPATGVSWHLDLDHWPGKIDGETVEMGIILTGEDYFKTMGMSIKEGRDFTDINDTLSVIFNETAIQRLRMKDPINQIITWQGKQYHIAGVVKDALMISPFAPADPTMFFTTQGSKGYTIYRLSSKTKTEDAIATLTTIFSKYNPAFVYSYEFADNAYANKFRLEVLIGKLAGIFAALAIFISLLGLFGLAAFIAEQRTKEIGVRKVLGASVSQVWFMLSKDFIVLVLISCAIASPIAFYFLQNWLLKYEYRIGIGPAVFIFSALLAIAVTLITVSFQAIKAAVANPVKSLRM